MSGIRQDDGQAMVEAPIVVFATLLMVLILVQVAIWLYTQQVANGAAATGARLLATRVESLGGGYNEATLEHYLLRRKFNGIPIGEAFVAGRPEIEFSGSPSDQYVECTVSIKQKPLPIVGFMGSVAMKPDKDGYITITGEAKSPGPLFGVEGDVTKSYSSQLPAGE